MSKLLIVFLMLIGCCSCKRNTQEASLTAPLKVSWANFTNEVYPDSVRLQIQAHFLSNDYREVWDSVVSPYYQEKNFFLWLAPDDRERIDTLLYWLDGADRHGLNPEMFARTEIKELVRRLEKEDWQNEETINHALATLEYLLTKAYIHYVCGMNYGFVHPGNVDGLSADLMINHKGEERGVYHIPFKHCTKAYVEQIFTYLKEGRISEMLREVQPDSPFYTAMQQEGDKYRPLAHAKFDAIPDIGNTSLKKGDSHKVVPFIARRLLLTGELSHSQVDTTSLVLTEELLQAVNKFRAYNFLPQDSVVGAFTVRYLNNPMSYYADRIKVNLERARWKYAQEPGKKYVVVNVAAFMLKAFNEETDSILEMRICCGTPYNKTPLLSSEIYFMDLNPFWNVPQSIIRKEMIPAYMRDSTYFSRNRMKLYDAKGNRLNPHQIDWSNRKGTISVRQDNREGNSLGRIIFRFPNSFAVYLHDTPAKAAFQRVNRAISHGCVRLEKPLEFAIYLLDKRDAILEDRIRLAMGLPALTEEGKQMPTQQGYKELDSYTLKENVPLFLDYQTMYLSADNTLGYCEDTYKYDKAVLTALEQLNRQYGTNKQEP